MKESILDVLLYLLEHYFVEESADPIADRDPHADPFDLIAV